MHNYGKFYLDNRKFKSNIHQFQRIQKVEVELLHFLKEIKFGNISNIYECLEKLVSGFDWVGIIFVCRCATPHYGHLPAQKNQNSENVSYIVFHFDSMR